jgi:hypothetical protein
MQSNAIEPIVATTHPAPAPLPDVMLAATGDSDATAFGVTVKWSVPDTGCPSSESNDHRIVHLPDTLPRVIGSETCEPRVTGEPLEMSFPDGANTCTFVYPATGGSSNVSRIVVGRATTADPVFGVEVTR